MNDERRAGWLVPVMVLMMAGCAVEDDPTAAWNALVEAERAFAQTAATHGTRSAFLDYLADESIIFRPTPVDGKAWFAGRPAAPGLLEWQPTFADVSQAGDLGYTTGPWTFRDSTGAPVAHGHYVSVWQQQADGAWRVRLDAGITHAASGTPASDAVAAPALSEAATTPRSHDAEAARHALLQADRDLADAASAQGSVPAFTDAAADSIRCYRDGAYPVVGKAAMASLQGRAEGVLTWEPEDAHVAQSGDLGYTYGVSTVRSAPEDSVVASSSYVRIWRCGPAGTWRVVLDLASPIPLE